MGSRSLEKCFEEAEETGTLGLHGRGLREFPDCIDNYDLTDVMRVDLSKNRFADLPHEVPTFFMLDKLDCSHNNLRCIIELSHLHSLSHVNLSHNQLTGFPVHICSLPIKILRASHNRLTSLPPEIGMMSLLQDLDVSCNELASVPSTIGDISPLRVLNLRRNHLVSLPDELSKLKNLLFLDFSCNKISVIPPAFRLITSLIKLDLKSNPLTSPPSQVCLKGRMHIFKFLSLAAQNQEKRWSIDRDIRRFKRTPSSTSASNNSLLDNDVRMNHVEDERQPEPAPTSDYVDSRPRKSSLQETRTFFERELEKGRDVVVEDSNQEVPQSAPPVRKPSVKKITQKISVSDAPEKERASPSRTRPKPPEKRKELKSLASPRTGRASTGTPPTSSNVNRSGSEKSRTIQGPRTTRTSSSFGKADRTKAGSQAGNTMSLDRSATRSYGEKIKSYSIAEEKNGSATKDGDFVSRKQQIMQSRQEALKSKQKLEQIKAKSSSLNRGPEPLNHVDSGSPVPASSADSLVQQSSDGESVTSNENAPIFDGIAKRNIQGSQKTTRVMKQGASSFTIRRLNDSAKEEFEQLEKLRNAIENRLKITLPDDLPAALADGVVLCHLINHLRKSTIAVIHVPSAGVPKLTMPKCQMNVDAFLEACRKMGVLRHRLCAPSDILEEKSPGKVCTTVEALFSAMKTTSAV